MTSRPDETEERLEALHERRAQQADFIAAHPSYDRALWIFSQKNYIRRLCQYFVEPSRGERIFGAAPKPVFVSIFKLVILAAIVGSVAIAAIATPVYRRAYFISQGDIRLTWFNLTEVSLGMLFIVEFLVKVIADGFVFAPNAYLLSIWNGIDFFVLLTLIVNVTTALLSGGGVSTYVLFPGDHSR